MAGRSRNAGRRLLVLKHDRWWFRRAIPVALQAKLGKGKFWLVNLNTSDLNKAQRLRNELERETSETFDYLRNGKSVDAVSLSAREQGILYRETIASLTEHQQEAPDDPMGLYDIAVFSAEEAADSFQAPSEREEFLDGLHGRDLIDAHLDAYLGLLDLAPRTLRERRGLVGRLTEWASKQRPAPVTLDRLNRRQAGNYVAEIIDKMHPATQGKHLTALRGYWQYLAVRGLIQLPQGESMRSGWPWNEQQIDNRSRRAIRDGQGAREREFTGDEIRTLLYSPDPKGMRSAHIPPVRDALKISLLSGMRMAEVLTLWVEEVCNDTEGNGLVFDIQQGKTEAAARRVPVHPDLIEIVNRRTAGKEGQEWLFHELASLRDPSDTFGKRFARYRQRLGVDEVRPDQRRSLVNFHSARRWFITAARHAEQPRETIANIVGHAPDRTDVTFGTYTSGASSRQMRDCVEAVQLPKRA